MRGLKKNCTQWRRQKNRRTWRLLDQLGPEGRVGEKLIHINFLKKFLSYLGPELSSPPHFPIQGGSTDKTDRHKHGMMELLCVWSNVVHHILSCMTWSVVDAPYRERVLLRAMHGDDARASGKLSIRCSAAVSRLVQENHEAVWRGFRVRGSLAPPHPPPPEGLFINYNSKRLKIWYIFNIVIVPSLC